MEATESIKKFIIRDKHGATKEQGSFSVVGDVHVDIIPGVGEPSADSTYENGELNITLRNIQGDSVADITTTPSQEDGGANVVTITMASGDVYQFTVLNGTKGSRGNGIASSSEELSDQDGGVNTFTFTDDDGNTHEFHTKNGRTGSQGPQGNTGISVGDNFTTFDEVSSLNGKTSAEKETMIPNGNAVGEIMDNVRILTGEEVYDFILTGAGANSAQTRIPTIAGREYTIAIDPTDFPTVGTQAGINIYSLWYRPKDSTTTTTVFATFKGSGTVPAEYTFRAVDAEYYGVTIRASSGFDVKFRLQGALHRVDYVDAVPTKDSTKLVESGGVYNVADTLGAMISGKGENRFALVGDERTGVTQRLTLIAGCTYKLVVNPTDYPTDGTEDGVNIYSLSYKPTDSSSSVNVFTTYKGSDTVQRVHTFTAEEASYYSVTIRAKTGYKVEFTLYYSQERSDYVDEVPTKQSYKLVESGGIYDAIGNLAAQISPSTIVPSDCVCDWPKNNGVYVKTRYRCAIALPHIPIKAKIEGVPEGIVCALITEKSIPDALDATVNGVEMGAWGETVYKFTKAESKVLCLNFKIGSAGTSQVTQVYIDDITENVIVTLTPLSESMGIDQSDIISANDEDKTIRYLRSLRRPIYSGTSYTAGLTPFTLLHFSDLHSDAVNLERILEYRDTYAAYIDDAIGTGDLIRNTYSESFSFWAEKGAESILVSTGNHEYYNGENSRYYTYITPKQVYDKFFSPYLDNWGDATFPDDAADEGYNYYYKDYAERKIRLIVLDNMANMSGTRDNIQATWLATVLEGARVAGYHVICAAHIGSTIETPFNNPFTAFRNNFNNDSGVNGQTYAEFYTLRNAVETFISNGGVFVCWISGHRHCDCIGVLTGYNQAQINVPTASSGHAWDIIPKGDDCDRTNGTKQQDCFNIYSVDTERRYLRVFRVGCDIDRHGRHKGILVYDYGNKTVLFND